MAPSYRKFSNRLLGQLLFGEYVRHNYNKIYLFPYFAVAVCTKLLGTKQVLWALKFIALQ